MRIARPFVMFCCGLIVGWLAVGSFMMVHDRAGIGGVLWVVILWLPVAAVYSVIIVAASHRLSRTFSAYAASSARLRRRFASILRVLAAIFFQAGVSPVAPRHSFGSCRGRCIRVGSRRAVSHTHGSNQSMKPTAPLRCKFSVLATTPCRGLSLSR